MSATVLVVDDDPGVRKSLLRLLRAHGYRPVGAVDGADALQKALSAPPAVIIMDLHMPVLDGIGAARQIRAHPSLQHIPIVALCAVPPAHEDFSSLFEQILLKPCPSNELLAAIEDAIV